MLKKTMTYNDLDGNPVTEDFYFNLSKAEIAELELSQTGGLSGQLKQIVDRADGGAIIKAFKEILVMSYGKRSADAKRFMKSKEISDEFLQTEAYSDLFMELVTNPEASVEFVAGIIPADLAADLNTGAPLIENIGSPALEAVKDTSKDPKDMSREELIEAMKTKVAERFSDQ